MNGHDISYEVLLQPTEHEGQFRIVMRYRDVFPDVLPFDELFKQVREFIALYPGCSGIYLQELQPSAVGPDQYVSVKRLDL